MQHILPATTCASRKNFSKMGILKWTSILVVITVFRVGMCSDAAKPECTSNFGYIRDEDCRGYWRCVWGAPIRMPRCITGMMFSTQFQVCVPEISQYNDCGGKIAKFAETSSPNPVATVTASRVPVTASHVPPKSVDQSISELCKKGAEVIPHPTECQLFYNCSLVYDFIPKFMEQSLDECPYPQLFSLVSYKCEDFENVDCASRKEAKSGCSYRKLQCPVAHCLPCFVRSPSCENQPDGLAVHEGRKWSPYYVRCYKERLLKVSQCNTDRSSRQMLFSPETGKCETLYHIPKPHGGMKPECEGKTDGAYPDETGQCNYYFKCENGEFTGMEECEDGTVYDRDSRTCQDVSETCAPCGELTEGC